MHVPVRKQLLLVGEPELPLTNADVLGRVCVVIDQPVYEQRDCEAVVQVAKDEGSALARQLGIVHQRPQRLCPPLRVLGGAQRYRVVIIMEVVNGDEIKLPLVES